MMLEEEDIAKSCSREEADWINGMFYLTVV